MIEGGGSLPVVFLSGTCISFSLSHLASAPVSVSLALFTSLL